MCGVQGGSIIGAIACDSHHFALLLKQAHKAFLIGRTCPRHNLDVTDAATKLVITQQVKLFTCNQLMLWVIGFSPKTNLTANLTRRARRVARHNLNADAGIEAILHRVGHIVANRVDDARDTQEAKVLALQLTAFEDVFYFLVGDILEGKAQGS